MTKKNQANQSKIKKLITISSGFYVLVTQD